MKTLIYPILLFPFLVLVSCHRGNNPPQESPDPDDSQTGTVTIDLDQFRLAGMKVGDPETMQFSDRIHVNGYITPSVAGMARVSSLVEGRVCRIYHTLGDELVKGDALFAIEGPEIIALQQEYAEVHQQLELLKQDDQRYQVLAGDSVVAEKDFLRIRSEYNTMLARSEGLKARLRIAGLNPEEIETGHIRSEMTVYAPIGGIVSKLDLVLGQFIEPRLSVMEIIDPDGLGLELRVFETDIPELKEGQEVSFTIPGQPGPSHKAILHRIGKSIDPESKTIVCLADLNDPGMRALVSNLFVEAMITISRRETRAVPEQAVIKRPDGDFVWIRTGQNGDRISFRMIPVSTGVTMEGYTEVSDSLLRDVLLQGAYDLPSTD
jgi:cobalt-zinc-cadmium efflux system membrane fusion protein